MKEMTEYQKLLLAEALAFNQFDLTAEVEEITTGKTGVANIKDPGKLLVAVFYGDDDGADDKVISLEEFNEEFRITKILLESYVPVPLF